MFTLSVNFNFERGQTTSLHEAGRIPAIPGILFRPRFSHFALDGESENSYPSAGIVIKDDSPQPHHEPKSFASKNIVRIGTPL